MIVSVLKFDTEDLHWDDKKLKVNSDLVQLVLVFGHKKLLQGKLYENIKTKFQNSSILITSTAGEIFQNEVVDNSIVVVAIQFEKTSIETSVVNIKDFTNSNEAGNHLISQLPKEKLSHVLVFSDGSLVNGSELVKGMENSLPENVMITGGLAGDGSNFHSTLVGINEVPIEGRIVAIGFYGDHIHISHGSQGGWEAFGLEKTITKSKNNVLFEIDGKNALDLYKKYLDTEVDNLPSAALLFPLSLKIPGLTEPVVRTILSINEEEKSMTFAGDVPINSKVRFMKANLDKITEAASSAAMNSLIKDKSSPDFALLISCVGRKLILGERISDEIKAIAEKYNQNTPMAGFYSYGEISPFNKGGACQLHNQTMTITSFYEY
jgi:hypothetical protein